MYLSRVTLDTSRVETIRALTKPAILHGAIEQSFNGEKKRRLWRIDQTDDACYVLVLSEDFPDFTMLLEQFSNLRGSDSWKTKSYSSFLERIDTNQTWHFRLCANPVHSVKEQGSMKRGKLFAHITREHQEKWLLERAPKNGFFLQRGNFDVIRSEWVNFSKNTEKHKKVSIHMAVFDGILTVTDANCFRKTLVTGIGRAKAYGCGLLTVMRL